MNSGDSIKVRMEACSKRVGELDLTKEDCDLRSEERGKMKEGELEKGVCAIGLKRWDFLKAKIKGFVA